MLDLIYAHVMSGLQKVTFEKGTEFGVAPQKQSSYGKQRLRRLKSHSLTYKMKNYLHDSVLKKKASTEHR